MITIVQLNSCSIVVLEYWQLTFCLNSKAAMTQTPSLKTQTLQVGGMDCGSCAKTIEVALQQLHGVTEATVNFTTGLLSTIHVGLLQRGGIFLLMMSGNGLPFFLVAKGLLPEN